MAQPTHVVAVTAVITRDNKALILKRSEKEVAFPGMWTIPGGKVEIGETVSNTILREVEEETSLKVVDTPKYLYDSEFTRPDGLHVVVVAFSCEVSDGEAKHSEDFTDLAWVGMEELDNHDIIPNVKEELKKFFHDIKK